MGTIVDNVKIRQSIFLSHHCTIFTPGATLLSTPFLSSILPPHVLLPPALLPSPTLPPNTPNPPHPPLPLIPLLPIPFYTPLPDQLHRIETPGQPFVTR